MQVFENKNSTVKIVEQAPRHVVRHPWSVVGFLGEYLENILDFSL